MDDERFARAFGDALSQHLQDRGLRPSEAARLLGVNKQTLMTYLSDHSNGKRNKARAGFLFQACAKLGFEFEYEGSRIGCDSPTTPDVSRPARADQLSFDFGMDVAGGRLTVAIRRPPGRILIDLKLDAMSK